jgi:cell division protein FtsN
MKNNLKRQHGGTLFGIIIGLVMGLVIAVIAAFMITKTPMPFTNKLGLTKGGDTSTLQLDDPNKSLYGHAARELMTAANKLADSAIQALPATPNASSNAASQSNTPLLTDLAKQMPQDAHSAMAPQAPAYYLQVGAFSHVEDAENVRAKLALMDVEANVMGAQGDNLYRVRIGPFDQIDAVNRMRSKLAENNIDVSVIKTSK